MATGKPNPSSHLTPSSSNTTSHGGLYNPYKGRLGARQLSESVSSFLSRLPPSKSSRDEWGPWIFIANPYTSHPLAREDWAGFKTAGVELLSSFSTKRAEIEEQFASNPQNAISQKLTPERKALEESICAAAKERNCTTGKWMLFPTSDNVDDVWEKVAIGTAEGQLGITAKVSTADVEMAYGGGVTWLVCVYTKDFIDKEDVKRVIVKLVELGLVSRRPVSYKCGECILPPL
jgi:hypothetical protein